MIHKIKRAYDAPTKCRTSIKIIAAKNYHASLMVSLANSSKIKVIKKRCV